MWRKEEEMPIKTSTKRTRPTMSASRRKAAQKVGRAMHELKHGTLKSSSGRKVTDPKQAIAIGLSEARRSGARIPLKKAPRRKRSGRV